MEKQAAAFNQLFTDARDYANAQIALTKLKVVHKAAAGISTTIAVTVVVVILTIGLLFLNIALALWLGSWLGKMYLGFIVVAGVYLVLAAFLWVFRNVLFKQIVTRNTIKKLVN
jgi:hypothetical protein